MSRRSAGWYALAVRRRHGTRPCGQLVLKPRWWRPGAGSHWPAWPLPAAPSTARVRAFVPSASRNVPSPGPSCSSRAGDDVAERIAAKRDRDARHQFETARPATPLRREISATTGSAARKPENPAAYPSARRRPGHHLRQPHHRPDVPAFTMITTPTPLQRRAFCASPTATARVQTQTGWIAKSRSTPNRQQTQSGQGDDR